MLSSVHSSNFLKLKRNLEILRIGDWFIVLMSLIVIGVLFQYLWSTSLAAKVQIRVNDKIYGTYSLSQQRTITVHGQLGDSIIQIARGSVRFIRSPCHAQYCVHQGWLKRAGQAAICLPNQITLELVGEKKLYDSLNY
jgi:hypothetical protein